MLPPQGAQLSTLNLINSQFFSFKLCRPRNVSVLCVRACVRACGCFVPFARKVAVPNVVRPPTQLGFELRARRRNKDWGLGEAGRLRQEAEVAINRRFPLWGRVDGAAMQHEKPSAVEALEALKAQEEANKRVYHAGRAVYTCIHVYARVYTCINVYTCLYTSTRLRVYTPSTHSHTTFAAAAFTRRLRQASRHPRLTVYEPPRACACAYLTSIKLQRKAIERRMNRTTRCVSECIVYTDRQNQIIENSFDP